MVRERVKRRSKKVREKKKKVENEVKEELFGI